MSITYEEQQLIESLGIKKHVEIVDGYIATGLDLDDITIHYGVDQERIIMVLHGYGFSVGSFAGDKEDSKKSFKKLPFHLVEAYISAHFPGILTESDEKQTTLNIWLDQNQPDWKNHLTKTKSSMFYLSPEETHDKS